MWDVALPDGNHRCGVLVVIPAVGSVISGSIEFDLMKSLKPTVCICFRILIVPG